MVNTILAKRVSHIVAKRDNPVWPKGSKSSGFSTAYETHLKTPHFQKYKQGTLEMVKDLELTDTTPLIPGLKIK